MTNKYHFAPVLPECLDKLVDLADECFTSDHWKDKKKGRKKYFQGLLDANPNIFMALYCDDGKKDSFCLAGYSSIIPEKPKSIKAHKEGRLNQYDLTEENIFDPNEKIEVSNNTFYFQAIAIDKNHRKSVDAKVQRDEMIANHFAKIMQNYTDSNFCVLGERFSEDGENFMVDHGWKKLPVVSATDHEMYLFNSTDANMTVRGRAFYSKIQKLRGVS